MEGHTKIPNAGSDINIKPKGWKNPPTVQDLHRDFTEAESYTAAHAARVNGWLEALKGNLKVKPKIGRSQVQPKLIRSQYEWTYPSLEDPFITTVDLFRVKPTSFADTESAHQNELILNKQFRVDIGRDKFITSYVRQFANCGSVLVKVGWEEEYGVVREEEEVEVFASTQEEVIMFLEAQLQANTIDQETAIAISEQFSATGEPIPIGVEMQTKLIEKLIKNRPTLEIKDIRTVIIDPSCKDNLKKAKFIVDRYVTDLSSLKSEADAIPDRYCNLDLIDTDIDTVDDIQIAYKYTDFKFEDKPRKKFVVSEYWGFWDIEGKGIIEPIVAAYVGNVMIRLERNPYPDKQLPYIIAAHMPIVDSIYGEPNAELLKDAQDITGALTRGLIDTFGRASTGQTFVRNGAIDELNLAKFNTGDDIVVNTAANEDIRNVIHTRTYPEVSRTVWDMLRSQTQSVEALTGTASFSNGVNSSSLGESVGGISATLSSTAKREASILRRLANGLKDIGLKIISMNSVFLSDEEVVQVTDEEFISIKRDDLAGDFDLVLTVSTPESDALKANSLAFLMQTIGNTMPIDITKLFLVEIAELHKMPELAKRIKDYDPQPDPRDTKIKELQIVLLEAQIETEQTKVETNISNARLRKAKADTEIAKTRNVHSKSDMEDLKFLEQGSGLAQDRSIEMQQFNKLPIEKS